MLSSSKASTTAHLEFRLTLTEFKYCFSGAGKEWALVQVPSAADRMLIFAVSFSSMVSAISVFRSSLMDA